MTSAVAPERQFVTFRRGEIREQIMTSWRIWLRQNTNPDTGQAFTETEIATATAKQSRWWIEADAIDLAEMANQQRGLFLADQIRIDRAATAWLENYHGVMWKVARLPATGGSGAVDAPATSGTVWTGSTTIPDAAAVKGRDPAGKRYQVLFTVITPAGGVADLTLKGIDTGEETNLDTIGTEITWYENEPVGSGGPAATTEAFTGGLSVETDADYSARILSRIRHKPAAGNNAHFRAWARNSSNAIEDAFVYACFQHAGSVQVCITQKRGNVLGPTARLASSGTLADATSYLTPPGSPVVPAPPLVLITTPTKQVSDLVLRASMPTGQAGGWTDLDPWPEQDSGYGATITAVTDQTHFEVTVAAASGGLPSGVTAPAMMVWNEDTSRFEELDVSSVTESTHPAYDVVLNTAPAKTLATTDLVSPDTDRRVLIAETIQAYFDSLGPGEVIDLTSDSRAHRAYRFPLPNEEYPQQAGSVITGWLVDALGATLGNAVLESISLTEPPVAPDPTAGPYMLVVGTVGIYAQ
jgi:hypothetical protein